jgi:NAD(P)-dependent dehydrogenase (short-subunit alcohol dehydrogenase family)
MNVSSELGSVTKNSFGSFNSYRCSKAALNMLTKNFSVELPAVTFVSVHPGWVQTDMGSSAGRKPPVTPAESASGAILTLT